MLRGIFQGLPHGGGLALQFALDQLFDDAMIALGGVGGVARVIELLVSKLNAALRLDLAAREPVAIMGRGEQAEALLAPLARRDVLAQRVDAGCKGGGAGRALGRGSLL